MIVEYRLNEGERLRSNWRSIMLAAMAVAITLVFALVVYTLGEANRQRDRALAAQRHSYDVMILARTLQGTIARSEAALGRYVISGDQSLGQLYYEDWRRGSGSIARLEKLTRDNPGQFHLAGALRAAYNARGNELALTALNTNYGRNSQALARYYQSRKAESLRDINTTLNALIGGERMLLEQRTSQAFASVSRSTGAAKVLAVLGLGLMMGVMLLCWAIWTALAQRAIAEAEAERERERADDLAAAVAQATDELRAQEGRLRQVQKMEAVGQLTGGIAHDFNNMLAVVLGGLELARRHLPARATVARGHIDSAQEGANRAALLTRQLLAFARETAINPEAIDAAGLFAAMADLLDRTLGEGITVMLHDRSDGWHIHADKLQLENTILNLAVNARDAMDGRGVLSIVASTSTMPGDAPGAMREYLCLAVSDTGSGMSPEVMERAFEPFFTTKPPGKGTGLGLSQTFSFARGLGGDVTVSSVPSRGTTVTLLLPRSERVPARVDAAHTVAPPPPPLPPGIGTGRHRVLVVEDDPRVLNSTVGALEELGYVVVPCDDPLRVPDLLDAHAPVHLILSDVLMPMRTGPEMAAALAPHHARTPIVFVTGYAGDAGHGLDLGGRTVLRKPFTLAALESVVATAIAHDQPEPLAAE